MSDSQPIRKYWQWFVSNIPLIANAYDNSDANWLRANVTPRVKSLGNSLNWEIGPYQDPDYTFVFSPTVRKNLRLTRSIVAAAPEVEGWHFLYAKPPKELLCLQFELGEETATADGWQYTLTAYNSSEFVDIDLYLDEKIPAEKISCELVVESLLGEELRLERVGNITPHVSNSIPDNATPIHYLKDHLGDVLGL